MAIAVDHNETLRFYCWMPLVYSASY